jgi:undecaprenyl-diphosphatase
MSSTSPAERVVVTPRSWRQSPWFTYGPLVVLFAITAVIAFVLTGQYQIAAAKGLVQGLGEPLPISSSAHLIITPWLFNWNDPFFDSQTFDVALHMGTLVALLGFFWRDWLNLTLHAHRPRTEQGRLFWLLVLASVPGALIGFVLDTVAENFFAERYLVIAVALAVMGVILYVADAYAPREYELDKITWRMALVIGLSQALALIPGVSRSGSTMTMGRVLKLKRETSARFSFLMAVPITVGAGLFKLRKLDPSMITPPFWLGIAVSTFVGALAIGFLLRYVRTRSFLPFVIYRVLFAGLIVAVYLLRK